MLSLPTYHTHQYINCTAGFLECRNVVNAAAELCLPRHYMDRHPSFKNTADMCQQPLPSAAAATAAEMTLEDVQAVAKLVWPDPHKQKLFSTHIYS